MAKRSHAQIIMAGFSKGRIRRVMATGYKYTVVGIMDGVAIDRKYCIDLAQAVKLRETVDGDSTATMLLKSLL